MATRNANTGTVYVTGDVEFQKLCKDLSSKVKNQIARKVMTVEAKRFLPLSRAMVPTRTGALKKSLIVAVKVSPRKGSIRVSYGPKKERIVRDMTTGLTGKFQGRMSLAARQQYKILRDPTRYAHLVELGTRPHKVRSRNGVLLRDTTGRTFGRVVTVSAKPHPFMRPVFDANAAGAISNILAESRRLIEQEVRNAAASSR